MVTTCQTDLAETFLDAVGQLSAFLTERGAPTAVEWVFREDLFFRSTKRITVRMPPPAENLGLSEKLYSLSAKKGLVAIDVLGIMENSVIATVWAPLEISEEIQGWSQGLRLSICAPLNQAKPVRSRMIWWWITRSPGYRRFQAKAWMIQPRRRVVAELRQSF